MAAKNRYRAELEALAAEIAGRIASPGDSATADDRMQRPEDFPAHDFEKMLRDLEHAVGGMAEDIEHVVAAQPLVALAAGVLLGIVIGRAVRPG